ncbi:hypothetical protein MNB_SUP05-SYMBIONT-5-369 [hydrothermal vent metagenome]|uniref:Uncharacterized protein n=1 Tax=hydrothermal vent metagenome TaxID=652676 RepID=A0A1W1E5R0_9ZZZZ
MKTLLLLIFFVNVTVITTANAKTFSAADLTSSATSEDCLDYCVDGVCFWLVCSLWGCSVKTTPHINHNLPDFVVSSYNEPGKNSFLEVQSLELTSGIQGGHLNTKNNKNVNSGIKFKEASVIGNPVAYAMGKAKYLCKSKIKPYMPYYLSTLDQIMWRSGLSDMLYPSTWVPGMNEVSSNKNQTDKFLASWGSLYPRSGFVNQKNEVKAASVIAARALEVVVEGGLRIYQPLGNSGNMKKNGKWQMVSPVEENMCRAFGVESVEELQEKVDEEGQYGWTAWRNYGCCIPGPGAFIGSSVTGCLN